MRSHLVLSIWVLVCGSPAWSAEAPPEEPAKLSNLKKYVTKSRIDATGVGLMYGRSNSALELSGVLGGDALYLPEQGGQHFFNRSRYGLSNFRIELGTGLGMYGSMLGGWQVLGAGKDEVYFPHLGLEPFRFTFSVNTDDDREDFIEWMPMISAGNQVRIGDFELIGLGRAGGAIGTLGNGGARPAAGGALLLSFDRFFGFGAELTRLFTAGDVPIDLGSISVLFAFRSHRVSVGLRAETIARFDPARGQGLLLDAPGALSERRVFLTVAKEL